MWRFCSGNILTDNVLIGRFRDSEAAVAFIQPRCIAKANAPYYATYFNECALRES